jgi:hypothetical protein
MVKIISSEFNPQVALPGGGKLKLELSTAKSF